MQPFAEFYMRELVAHELLACVPLLIVLALLLHQILPGF
jgi:hypothetical protein